MTGNSSSGATQEPDDENMPDRRFTRRQAAYSLTALVAAVVVAAFGFAFAYQSVADSNSSHLHAADSGTHSHGFEPHSAINDEAMEMTSLNEMAEEPAHDDDAGHFLHEDASEDHGHGVNE